MNVTGSYQSVANTMNDLLSNTFDDRPPHARPGVRRPLPGPVFFAFNLDAGAAAKAGEVTRRLRAMYGLTGEALGAVQAACKAASSIAASPFEVVFDRAMSFSRKRPERPLVLVGTDGSTELTIFRRSLAMEMKRAICGFKTRSTHTPHITLLYDRRAVPEQPVEPVRWTVRELVLIHSLHGLSRHVPLARWPLNN